MTTIMIVEDDPAIQDLLAELLRRASFDVVPVGNAESALESIKRELPDLLILDWMLPSMSGMALARRLRGERRTRALPIIMLTARGEEEDKLEGLEHGADDYVTKPFSPKELLARIRALLRRRSPEHVGETLRAGALELDPQSARVHVNGREIPIVLPSSSCCSFSLRTRTGCSHGTKSSIACGEIIASSKRAP